MTIFSMNLADRLNAHCRKQHSFLCVGLDPDLARLPETVLRDPDPVFRFCREIVDATAPFCAAFKPQIAYFAALAAEHSLERLMQYIRDRWPAHILVLDAKRNDIGDTAKHYAREAFDRYLADYVTVSPYLGADSLTPFLERADRGCLVLCRTSNPDSGLVQLHGGSDPTFHQVARWVEKMAAGGHQVGLVAGATHPGAMAEIRSLAPTVPFLVPGIGAQGGDLGAALKEGRNQTGGGLLINSSRSILYASAGSNFAEAAANEARNVTAAMHNSL